MGVQQLSLHQRHFQSAENNLPLLILAFLSLMYQDEDPGQKDPCVGVSLMGEAKGLRSHCENPDDTQ